MEFSNPPVKSSIIVVPILLLILFSSFGILYLILFGLQLGTPFMISLGVLVFYIIMYREIINRPSIVRIGSHGIIMKYNHKKGLSIEWQKLKRIHIGEKSCSVIIEGKIGFTPLSREICLAIDQGYMKEVGHELARWDGKTRNRNN